MVRMGQSKSNSLIARPMSLLQLVNCVSPSYLAKFGAPATLDDLSSHNFVFYSQQLAGKGVARVSGRRYAGFSALCSPQAIKPQIKSFY